MTIPVHKLVCGNCTLRKDGKCTIQGDKRKDLRLACAYIHQNFEDNGYALEETHLDWDKINKEMEEYETVEEMLKREEIRQ